MKFHLYKVSGYEEAMMAMRMSRGKFNWLSAQDVQELVYACTDRRGFLADKHEYVANLVALDLLNSSSTEMFDELEGIKGHAKITGIYHADITEFRRLLNLVMSFAMGPQGDHSTLMSYIDVAFITEGLHRGAQDDLDAHARGFNNRITRFSTRLATIDEVEVSEWYKDKIIPFHDGFKMLGYEFEGNSCVRDSEGNVYKYTPFGFVLAKYADMNHDAAIRHDVIRGLIPLGTPGPAIWKASFHDLHYIYLRRGMHTKANPELKEGIEQLADQITKHIPVFGAHFRDVYTDDNRWEPMHRTKNISMDAWKEYQRLRSHSEINDEEM